MPKKTENFQNKRAMKPKFDSNQKSLLEYEYANYRLNQTRVRVQKNSNELYETVTVSDALFLPQNGQNTLK